MRYRLLVLLAAVSLAAAYSWFTSPGDPAAQTVKPHVATPALDKSAAMQSQRLDFINKLRRDGIIGDIDVRPGLQPRVTVKARFILGDFKDKQNIASAIYAYYFDGTKDTDMIHLVHWSTGKDIGYFSRTRGLQLE